MSNHLKQRLRPILRNLTKKFGNFHALNDVSFGIKEGEIFGYIGPNGAGKTTTMKILVGLISDFQGEVSIGGYQVPKNRRRNPQTAGLSSSKRCFPRMAHRKSSAQNIWQTLGLKRRPT